MPSHDVLVIGGGHNGLVCAARLAQSGRRVLVLERSDRIGGCLRTDAIATGFRCPTLAHTVAIDPAVARTLGLERHGIEWLHPGAHVATPLGGGRALVLWRDEARARESIRGLSHRDADVYSGFLSSFSRISGVLRSVLAEPPPSIDTPGVADLIGALTAGRRFRALGRADAHRLLRWLPMPVADLVGDEFESEPLRATIGAGGVFGSFLGPRSAGSAAALLVLGAADGHPVSGGGFARGAAGAVADALAAAARAAGVDIRTAADVARIDVEESGATGVTLASGETLTARTIVSNADPKRTFWLVDPMFLDPEFVQRITNLRTRGSLAKVNYAVSSLPSFEGASSEVLSGRIRLAHDLDSIERAFDCAKYGAWSPAPWIELTIPSLLDPSLAPAGAHVVSAYVQYAPYELRGTRWDTERDALGDAVTRAIDAHSPGFASSVVARQVMTPLDLERDYALTGGHIFHAELAFDQLFVARPLLGWARYRTPIGNLYLCGAGTHPGAGATGMSGMLAANAILKSE